MIFPLLLALLLLSPSPTLSLPNPNTSAPIPYASLTCPPPHSPPSLLLPTPSYGSTGAVFGICTSVLVSAPARLIYAALLDFSAYDRWNTFIVSVALPPGVNSTLPPGQRPGVYPGMRMTLISSGILGSGLHSTSEEVITVLSDNNSSSTEGYLLAAWRYDDLLSGLGSRAEHPTVLVDLGNGTTRMLSYETYYEGLFTGTVALLQDVLQERFEAQARDLKAYVEGIAK
ncbi:hypothetical protein F4810DRAFT_712400 [Camillea tinctor]|nr:hypothetical protein F4810DRAFT_712400 [Camillea tinctor]